MDVNQLTTVIIRSVGERTEQLCYELLKKQINEENIFIISDTPFAKTLEKTFIKALDENRKWTLCIDSDVLVRPNLIKEIIELAEKQNENVFLVQGTCMDKFLYYSREVGQRLYRTETLEKGLKHLKMCVRKIRPESYVVDEIKSLGFEKVQFPEMLIGIHDFEQFYEDIYRKCFTHVIKHQDSFNMKKITETWKKHSAYDDDFKVAYIAYQDTLKYSKKIYIDKNAEFMNDFDKKLKKLNIKEKKNIRISEFEKENVFNEILLNFLKQNVFLPGDNIYKPKTKIKLNTKPLRRIISCFKKNK